MARAFLDTLRDPTTLLLASADGEAGARRTRGGSRIRGQFAMAGASILAATPPDPELLAHLRTLGLGAERVFAPAVVSWRKPLTQLVLEDAALLARLRRAPDLSCAMAAFKDASAAQVLERIGLPAAWCAPSPDAYAHANDKLAFAQAAARFGFDAVPLEPVADAAAVAETFDALSQTFGEGCIVRLRRGSSGHGVHRARSRRAAVRRWRRLRPLGEVLLAPYVPPGRVVRNVATHGIVTGGRFAPLVFSDQIVRGTDFRGGRVEAAWTTDERAAIAHTLDGVARWLATLGYAEAPAGVDGFLVREAGTLRFLALDPNIRLTATMMPWAIMATLAEAADRAFVWQFETHVIVGAALSFARLVRRLGDDLLRPEAWARGGIVPTLLAPAHLGVGRSVLSAILIATDAGHLAHLAARVQSLGLRHL